MAVTLAILMCMALMHQVTGEVCYSKYGCFNNKPPFSGLLAKLPQSPDVIKTSFHLFTRAHRQTSQILDDEDPAKLVASDFDGSRQTLILIHGLQEHSNIPWMNHMRAALLERDDVNLITADWYAGARLPLQSIANARLVGAQVAKLIKFLVDDAPSSADLFYIVGFGLGAHVGGHAGRHLKKESLLLGRITGLDPSGPFFDQEHRDVRLDSTDADFVDVIHTDTDGIGIRQPSGHIDFFPNGGATQPHGCDDSITGIVTDRLVCDHMRATDYYTESVSASCPMHAFPCNSLFEFNYGRCMSCDGDCPTMGYHAVHYKGKAAGKYILETAKSSPFCVYHYQVSFETGYGLLAGTSAPVTIKLVGKKGDTGDIQLKSRTMSRGTTQSFVAVSRNDVGDLTKIDVRFNGIPYLERWHLVSVVVKPGWQNKEYTACFNAWLRTSGGVRAFQKDLIKCR